MKILGVIMEGVTKGVKFIFKKENRPYVLSIVIFILILLFFDGCRKNNELKRALESEKTMNQSNLTALMDSITTIKTDMNEFMSFKNAFITSVADLSKYDADLSDQISNLEGKIISYIDSKWQVNIPSIVIDNDLKKYPDGSTFGLLFHDTYQSPGLNYKISGESKFKFTNETIYPGQTLLDTNQLEIGLKYGFRETDDQYEVFAISPSPLVTINDLDGALLLDKNNVNSIIDPGTPGKQTRLYWSMHIGACYFPMHNDISGAVGIGLSYNLIPWNFGIGKNK